MKCIKIAIILMLLSLEVGSNQVDRESALPFSMSNVLMIMEQVGIVYPDIVIAQARLETGNFTSKVFVENHNLFGMRLAKSRATNALGEKNNHANYKDWIQSVVDYKIWQDSVTKKYRTRRAYLKYLSTNYAEDKQYIHKLKQML